MGSLGGSDISVIYCCLDRQRCFTGTLAHHWGWARELINLIRIVRNQIIMKVTVICTSSLAHHWGWDRDK